MVMSAELLLRAEHVLAEGPHHDAASGELSWVDIHAGTLHRASLSVGADGPRLGDVEVGRTTPPLGAAIPLAPGDGWLLVRGTGFEVRHDDGTSQVLGEPEATTPGSTRMNDAACDTAGRCWAGSMFADEPADGLGALYRVGPDGDVERVLAGVTLSNGIAWSPDGGAMYHVDSGPGTITRYVHDGSTGALGEGAVIATYDDGTPDGMTVDAAGNLWVAVWGGSRVDVLAPDGGLLDRVDLPVPQPTSVAFAGPDLDVLVITTAREGLDDDQLAAAPLSGSLFCVPGVGPGLPQHPFGHPG